MERYSEYKDSCVQWIGEVPSHWEVKRLASYFTERKIKVSDKEYAPLSVTKNGVFSQLDNVAKTNDGDNRKLVLSGDFVINSRSDRKGSSGIAKQDGSVSLINIVLKPRKNIYPDFCNYLLKCYSFIEEYYRNGRGIVADLWTTRYDEMKTIKIPVPSLNEQKSIVTYLNKVVSKIDKAITQQQKIIELLNERKQIIIKNAVTKGLNPNVPMKDSGVEWIGEIPEHWIVSKAKNYVQINHGSDPKTEGNVPVYGSGAGSFKTCGEYKLGPVVLLGRKGATLHIPHYITGKYWNVDTAFDVKVINMDLKFYYYLAFCFDYKFYMDQTTLPSMTQWNYRNMKLPCPPINEQSEISNALDQAVFKIEQNIQLYQKLIFLLQERKQIIINDVVTGKVKVS